MIQLTIDRIRETVDSEEIFIVTSENYKKRCRKTFT